MPRQSFGTKEQNSKDTESDVDTNIVLIGAPGSGKGTQSERLVDRYHICQLSTGDLLRQAASDQTSIEGEEIRKTMRAGGLVDDKIVLSLIDQNLGKASCRHGVLFDGFPRTIKQGEKLEELLKSKGKKLDAVIEYAIDDDLLKSRILGRLVHKSSGRTYHEEFHPPKVPMKDDVTGEPLERRSDDTIETLTARLNTYHKQTAPLINFYQKRNLHQSIDASQNVNDISKQSIAIIDRLRNQTDRASARRQANEERSNIDESYAVENKPITNYIEADSSRFSENFLFVYKSVSDVLRERGMI